MSLKRTVFFSVVVFSTFSLLLLIRHEYYLITHTGTMHSADNYKLRDRFRSAYEASIQIVEKLQNISSADFVFPQPLEMLFFSKEDDDEDEDELEEGIQKDAEKEKQASGAAAANSNNNVRADGYETTNESANGIDIVPETSSKENKESNTGEITASDKVALDDLVKDVINFSKSRSEDSAKVAPAKKPVSESDSESEIGSTTANSLLLKSESKLDVQLEVIEELSPKVVSSTPIDPVTPVESAVAIASTVEVKIEKPDVAHLRSRTEAVLNELAADDDDDDEEDDDDTIDPKSDVTTSSVTSTTTDDKKIPNKDESGPTDTQKKTTVDDDDDAVDDDEDDDVILSINIKAASAPKTQPHTNPDITEATSERMEVSTNIKNSASSSTKTEAKNGEEDDDDALAEDDDFNDDYGDAAAKREKKPNKQTNINSQKSDSQNPTLNLRSGEYMDHKVDPEVAEMLDLNGIKKPRYRKGTLTCQGKKIDSDVIYWRDVEGDQEYVSPIIPPLKSSEDGTRYLSFEYDAGGWNNMRMSMECLIIIAHAFNRTLVLPPPQHIYLLSQKFVTEVDGKKQFADEMGFEDFFHVDAMRSQKGMHVMSMKEFLAKEGITGRLHGIYPPGNDTEIWGRQTLWPYLNQVADVLPVWGNAYFALPLSDHDYTFSDIDKYPPLPRKRFEKWKTDREPILYYNRTFQQARHLHVPGEGHHRILMHHYSYVFAADLGMQQFYKRFVRDYIRYKDEIFCVAHEVIEAIRKDALAHDPSSGGQFYSLHIRRGDFQFKDVKISAQKIWQNLHFPDGTAVIPNGSFVYIATDDPDGVCKDCLYNKKPCESYKSPKPVGCPEDTSWNAFLQAGWKLKFLRDYSNLPVLRDFNPNYYGMVEVIIGTQAKAFAGTVHSTFTGLTLRIRGFQGRTSSSYYHSNGALLHLQKQEQGGTGWWREWSYGWHDDLGTLV